MSAPRVYLICGGGIPNYGDELIAGHWLEFLHRTRPEADVFLDSHNGAITSVLLRRRNLQAAHVDFVHRIANVRTKPGFWDNLQRGYEFFRHKGFRPYPRLAVAQPLFTRLEILHLIGGGYINSKWPHTGFLLGFAAGVGREFGTKVIGTGLGLLPLEAPPPEFADLFDAVIAGFAQLETRDLRSADYLRRHAPSAAGISAGIDDSFLAAVPRNAAQDGPTLHLSAFTTGARLHGLIRLLHQERKHIDADYPNVTFWNCAAHRDADAQSALRKLFPRLRSLGVAELLDGLPIKLGDSLITDRFHPHLLASRAGLGGYFGSVGDYYDTKHGSVRELGSAFRRYNGNQLDFSAPLPASAAMAAVDAARVDAKNNLAAALYA